MRGDLLKALFVPSEERLNSIQNTVSSKFSFVDSIKISIESLQGMLNNVDNVPKLTLHLGSTKYTQEGDFVVLDLSWYAPFKAYGDLVLTGFIYIFFIWRMFISAPNIIQGVAGVVQSDYMVSDIQAYNKFGIGRSPSLSFRQDKNGGVYRK